MPKVSVIIATYNRAHYIREAIDSVLSQTFTDYEIIVVDDGSTDNTRAVVGSYGSKVKYFYQKNQGQPAAENHAARESTGEYIALLDDDDIWFPNKLEVQLDVLENNRDIGFVCNEAYYINETGTITFHWKRKPWNQETFLSLFEGNFIHHSSVLIRRKLFEQVGGFDDSLITTQDYDLWLRMAYISKFRYINTPLTKFRQHPQNKHKNKLQKLPDRVRVVTKAADMAGVGFFKRNSRIAREYYTHAEYFQIMELYGLAGRTYLKSALIDPFIGRHFPPPGTRKILLFLPYRILRTYVRAFYCFSKQLYRIVNGK
jgi:glycosyltransferase involved in cell wall biosynthesis